jgi:hypothetical protein
MSLWKEIGEIASSKADLRKFGLTMAVAFGLLGGFMAWKGHGICVYFLGAAGFFLFFGLGLPQALKPVQKVWMALALVMGWFMSRVLLTVTFFVTVTPIGLILRATGKDLLDKKTGVKRDTYWVPHRQRNKEEYENQF